MVNTLKNNQRPLLDFTKFSTFSQKFASSSAKVKMMIYLQGFPFDVGIHWERFHLQSQSEFY